MNHAKLYKLLTALFMALGLCSALAWPVLAVPSDDNQGSGEAGGIVQPTSAFPGVNGKIAYNSFDANGVSQIYVMNADGTNPAKLTDFGSNRDPSWSADGTKIAFTSTRDGGNPEIYVMNADGSGQIRLTNNANVEFSPSWSPDGSKIALLTIGRSYLSVIVVMNADGTNQTVIFSSPSQIYSLNWSPDGSKIAFAANDQTAAVYLYLINADGTGKQQFTNFQTVDSPSWSPDGRKLVFMSDGRIWTVNADGSAPANLTSAGARDNYDPAWSPDGSKIVFLKGSVNSIEIYVMNADGSNQTRLTNNTELEQNPNWQPLPAGTIVIVKDAQPEDNTPFTFDSTIPGVSSFTLQDPAANTRSFSNVPAGAYLVKELGVGGWTLHKLSCDDPQSGEITPGIASIKVTAGKTVTCTFQNVKNNSIIVNKFTVGGDAAFAFTTNLPGGAFNLTTVDGFAGKFFGGLAPGAYNVAETLPGGWNALEADPVCSNGDHASAITLAAGEVAICNFYNLAQNTIVVKKQTIGGDGAFGFSGDLGAFTLTTQSLAASQVFTGLVPGAYGITETVPAGWVQTGATCDNGDTPANVTMLAGMHVTCTFTNTKQAVLRVVKLAESADGSFPFNSNIPGSSSFTLNTTGGVAAQEFADLLPGAYAVQEVVPAGWIAAEADPECSNGDRASAITLDAGEVVACVFINLPLDTIVIRKQTIGGDGSFGFTGDLGAFTLTTSSLVASQVFTQVVPGTYGFTETLPAGWDQTGATCDNGNTPDSVNLLFGQRVTCTFTNTKQASLTIVKQAVGADDTFSFTSTVPGQAIFVLTTTNGAATQVFANLAPGTYSVAEAAQMGWAPTSAACSNGSAPAAVAVAVGEDVICTFTNTRVTLYMPLTSRY